MQIFFTIAQIIAALVCIVLIFLQSQGLDQSNSNLLSSTASQKRGWEKVTFVITLVSIAIFLGLALIQTII